MTKLNEVLSLDHEEAIGESSCFYDPINTKIICWVGANERPEFLRQNRNISRGLVKKIK